MSDNEEFIREFLDECEENLDQLDQDLVTLETNPRDADRLASIFRTIHTIKGTSGFFGYAKLGSVAHTGESLLSRLRDGRLLLNPEITSALLALVDAIREILGSIESNREEGSGDYRPLTDRLAALISQAADKPIPVDDPTGAEKTDSGHKPESPTAIEVHTEDIVGPDPFAKSETPTASLPAASLILTAEEEVPHDSLPPVDRDGSGESLHVAGPDDGGGTEAMSAVEPEPDFETSRRSAAVPEGSVRVDVGLLNQLMDLVGELVLTRNQLLQFTKDSRDGSFLSVAQRMNHITTDLQERVMRTRMQPVGNVWNRFPRVVRDLAVACGKDVILEMEGQDTELDKSLLEAIRDPLTHLLRNAIDHGIESPELRMQRGKSATGQLLLRAWHEGGQVNIEFIDDGGGIDPEKVRKKAINSRLVTAEYASTLTEHQLVQMIFQPGFSTAERVTDVSGRGVGMDVVRTNIESIGGSIDIHSHWGLGTTIRIKIPLTLAIVPALIVGCGCERFAIPQSHLLELLRLNPHDATRGVEMIGDAPVYRLRGSLLPLLDLNRELRIEGPDECRAGLNILVLQADERRFGLIVDSVHSTEEIVVKPLDRTISSIPHFAGATIMGDGRVALIVDVFGLAAEAGLDFESTEVGAAKTAEPQKHDGEHQSLLICELGSGRRLGIPLQEVDRLEEFALETLEQVANHEVVQYRGEIMPLIRLAQLLRESPAGPVHSNAKTVVVCHTGQSCGIVVERILDVVQSLGPVRPAAGVRGICGSAIVDGRVVEVVDVAELIESSRLFAEVLP